MKLKKLAMVTLTLALTAGSAMTSLAAGWKHSGGDWKYQWSEGNYATNCWINHKNNWYYVGDDGLLRRGWIYLNDTWYFAAESGEMLTGLIKVNGNIYYMDGNKGNLFVGKRAVRGTVYDFTANGTTNGAPYLYESWNSDGSRKTAAPIKP